MYNIHNIKMIQIYYIKQCKYNNHEMKWSSYRLLDIHYFHFLHLYSSVGFLFHSSLLRSNTVSWMTLLKAVTGIRMHLVWEKKTHQNEITKQDQEKSLERIMLIINPWYSMKFMYKDWSASFLHMLFNNWNSLRSLW